MYLMALFILPTNAGLHASGRETLFDKNWKFYLGSIANAEQPIFNDSMWRILDLPHDWSVEPLSLQRENITIGPFSRMSEGFIDTGHMVGGEGWYRKEFTISNDDADKCISLYFEGVYNQSEVWINGKKAHFNPYGYTSYRTDITSYCNAPGVPNIIAVKVVNSGRNSRWYSGSGIFRHVWLIKTEKLHLDKWDTFVTTSGLRRKGKEAEIRLSTIIHRIGLQNQTGEIGIKIYSPSGNKVFSTSQEVRLADKTPVTTSFPVQTPELWSVDAPVLYRVEVSVSSGGREYDRISIPFGIRTIAFSAEKGFQLNGKSLKLKGGCLHHDNGLLGAVAIDRAEERKVELLKANGYNAVRCSHNLTSEYFLDACDRLGMLVIHETFDQWQKPKRDNDYHQFFDEWGVKDLTAGVRRDRNHPSIIMWSIRNEIQERADAKGEEIAEKLVSAIKQYDDSRFTTAGVNWFWDNPHYQWETDSERAFRNIDIAGYNYAWDKYENDHATHPKRIMYGSESYPKDAAINWNLVEKHSYIIGDFVWAAMDYLGEAALGRTFELSPGEPSHQNWPWYNSWCGDIDLCGDKKPQSYYRDIVWRERAISMAVRPAVTLGKYIMMSDWGWSLEQLTWNWRGMEGKPMTVNIYSRSPKVKLYLNDKLVGEKETGRENYIATFEVPYEPGILKAVNAQSKEEFILKTTGKPSAIRLTADRDKIKASRNDLSYVKIELIDKDGNVVPDTSLPVSIQCSGNGHIIAAGNAAYDDMKSFRSLTPNTFRGKAMAIVQPDEAKGTIQLTVSAEGLEDVSILIKVE